MKEFDYYIFIDYSENLIGYNIIGRDKIQELIPKISKFTHFKSVRHKRAYIHSIKKTIDKESIDSYILKMKIKNVRDNLDIFIEVSEFIREHENCIIFISVDNFQYQTFRKVVNLVDGNNVEIVKESNLKKNSREYKLSLIIDTQLNILRRRNK